MEFNKTKYTRRCPGRLSFRRLTSVSGRGSPQKVIGKEKLQEVLVVAGKMQRKKRRRISKGERGREREKQVIDCGDN